MTEIFVMRDRINRFVKEYETWFLIIAKFIGMMFVFSCVNSQLGYFEVLNNPMVNILLALICSIIPGSFSVFIVAAVIAAHMVKLSVLLAVLTVVVMLIVYLMFLKFAPGTECCVAGGAGTDAVQSSLYDPILAGMYFSALCGCSGSDRSVYGEVSGICMCGCIHDRYRHVHQP